MTSPSRVLQAGSVLTPAGMLSPGWVAVEEGTIAGTGAGVRTRAAGGGGDTSPASLAGLVDLGPLTLSPGFVDVHVHGGDGAQVNGGTVSEVVESVARIARFHARHGTTTLLATTVSDTPERLLTTVTGLAAVVRADRPAAEGRHGEADRSGSGGAGDGGGHGGAVVRGIHLEGPFIARAKMGAQDPSALRPVDIAELRRLATAAGRAIRLVTVAPELDRSTELIAEVLSLGAAVAIGHTDASYDATCTAIEAGATHATHLFNAMAPLHHRMPGAVTALLLDDRVTVEVIADLEHLHPAVLALVARVAPGRLVVVSDAVTATGLEPGTYQLGRLDVEVRGGRVSLAANPQTLAGSVLTMDVAVRNLVGAAGLSVDDALTAASATPARAAGLDALGVGRVEAGSPADLVLLDADLGVVATLVGGDAVFDPTGLLRLPA
ncbi:MAG: N-acetylglucosamine-6-phosphate deacetylase [Acidimicrobiales bacterium]